MPSDVGVEINLKIPRLTLRSPNEPDKVIDNGSVRFIKRIIIPAIPKVGDSIQLSTKAGQPFDCEVTRTEWSDEKERFVVYCKYSKRSIPPAEYGALVNDSDWEQRGLL
jgi:hypothetical protein